MLKGQTHIRCVNPCRRCVHLPDCVELLRRLSDVVKWEEVHRMGANTPTVIVDCEGRFTPPSRYKPLRLK